MAPLIPHYSVTVCLLADKELRAPVNAVGTYITLFGHYPLRDPLDQLSHTRARTLKGLLKQVKRFQQAGGTVFWKGGEVKPGNRFYDRLDTLTSLIHSGRPDVPTTLKVHDLLVRHGGHALALMLPVSGYTSERKLMAKLSSQHNMEFDNYGRDPRITAPIKKRWLPCRAVKLTL